MKRIYFTVTNDLSFDQRMHRICTTLAENGYEIVIIGRKLRNSLPLTERIFKQKRISCIFNKGPIFYAEYNFRLFFFLLFKKMHGICAIDLDTIIPCLLVSKIKGIPRIYDAHEYFTELKEVRTRTRIKKTWKAIERFAVPKFKYGYTVSSGIAEEFNREYKRNYEVIRNLPVLRSVSSGETEKVLLYQGAVNEARGFEYLIPAMKQLPYKLIICGDGNFMDKLKKLIAENEVQDKVELKGMLSPDQLRQKAEKASLGLCLAEKEGLNQYLALPNKFFEYMHALVPQIAMNYPEYQKINSEFKVAVLIDELSVEAIIAGINKLMTDDNQLKELRKNCLQAREVYSWQNEEGKLILLYNRIFKD